MNILFISLLRFKTLEERNIYTDLLREFAKKGHHVDVISPTERKYGEATQIMQDKDGNRILSLRIGNIQKCNIIEKGLTTISLESKLIRGVKKYFSDTKYDLILYTTPPITFGKVVAYVKKRDGARTYLLLKDIFPQNAVDLGMMLPKSFVYKYFRKKEVALYKGADAIGCMSEANVDYVLKHNEFLSKEKVCVCPNSIEPRRTEQYNKMDEKAKQNLPKDSLVFVYGGNLGKPQDVDFIIRVLKLNANKTDRFFLICGGGTDAWKLEEYITSDKPENVRYIPYLPKAEYDEMLKSCDIGMIVLDHRFTIPNFPSRLLSYLDYAMPVVAFTDVNTDIGSIVADNGFGWWAESRSEKECTVVLDEICAMDVADIVNKGNVAREYLENNYSVENVANQI